MESESMLYKETDSFMRMDSKPQEASEKKNGIEMYYGSPPKASHKESNSNSYKESDPCMRKDPNSRNRRSKPN